MKGLNWVQIRNDRHKGLSYTEIGRKHNVDRRTAKRYADSADKPTYQLGKAKPSKLNPYKHQIDIWLEEAPYSAQRIFEKLVEQGFQGKASIVRQHVSTRKKHLNEKATVRFETMPGLQGQVDWGYFENHTVNENGVKRKLYCFLMILGYSRTRYIEFVTDMSTSTLIRCHINAFRYMGGYPAEILYDNMKQVVIKRLLKQSESEMNKQFEDFSGFYGFNPVLCRPYRGQTKGKVERTVSFVRDNFMVGLQYQSLADLNNQAIQWCNKVNGNIHGTTNERPFDRLREEGLSPLKREYIIDKINLRRVGKDCLISYAQGKYSVPAAYVGRDVSVIVLEHMLAIYADGKQIALHRLILSPKGMAVNPQHYKAILEKQSFDTPNSLLRHSALVDFTVHPTNLSAYDEAMGGEEPWKN